MKNAIEKRIAEATGADVSQMRALSGGCIGDVYAVDLGSGETAVAKVADGAAATLDIEAYMLTYLAEHSDLPVPKVLHASPDLLVMEFMPGGSQLGGPVQAHAAKLLSALHNVRGESHGLDRGTLIGGLHQPNPKTASWIEFFAEHRVRHMAAHALKEGRLDKSFMARIDEFCGKLDDLILEPEYPSLLHGDVWTTNVLAEGGRVTAFIDPAVYYGHPEIELAFSTLFGTFGDAFFKPYHELRPIADGFFESRRDIYNIYPLLVHVRLFGSSYLSGIDSTLRRHGC